MFGNTEKINTSAYAKDSIPKTRQAFDTALDFDSRDLKRDNRSMPFAVTGEKALLQRIQICLSMPLGSFVYDSSMGSRLRDTQDPPELLEIARQALKRIPEAELIRAEWKEDVCFVSVRIPHGIRTIEIRR